MSTIYTIQNKLIIHYKNSPIIYYIFNYTTFQNRNHGIKGMLQYLRRPRKYKNSAREKAESKKVTYILTNATG